MFGAHELYESSDFLISLVFLCLILLCLKTCLGFIQWLVVGALIFERKLGNK
jgi:hypothetical protein